MEIESKKAKKIFLIQGKVCFYPAHEAGGKLSGEYSEKLYFELPCPNESKNLKKFLQLSNEETIMEIQFSQYEGSAFVGDFVVMGNAFHFQLIF